MKRFAWWAVLVTLFLGVATMVHGQAADPAVPRNGLVLWLRADEGVEKDAVGYVTAWRDQPGRGNDAVAEDLTEPLFVASWLSGQPAIRFNASDTFLRVPHAEELNAGDGFSVFIVYSYSKGGRLAQKKNAASGVNPDAWFLATATGLGVSGVYHEEHMFFPDMPYLQSNIFDAQAGTVKIYDSGWLVGTVEGVGAMEPNEDDLYIGKRHRPGSSESYFGGEIAEMMIYDRALGDEERQAVEKYLADKYGLMLF